MLETTRRDFMKLTAFVASVLAVSQMPNGETLLRGITPAEAEALEADATTVTTTLANLHLGGFAMGSEPCAVDTANGRVIRIRPLHFDWQYAPSEIKLPAYNVKGKVFNVRPSLKSVPSYLALAYKKRTYSPGRVRYPLQRVDFDPTVAPASRNYTGRGKSGFVRISWDKALSVIEDEITRIKATYGLNAVMVFADGHGQEPSIHCIHGYGHTLFDLLGGCTHAVRNPDSWEGYYYGSKHVGGWVGNRGIPMPNMVWEDIWQNGEMLIVSGDDQETTPCGFVGHSGTQPFMLLRNTKIKVVYISPDFNYGAAAHAYWQEGSRWIPILPGTDAALYLAVAYVWIKEGTYDKEYVATRTVGFDNSNLAPGEPAGAGFKEYIMGEQDGVPKTPKWAEPITGIPSRVITALAREWASKRTSFGINCGGALIRVPYAAEPARLQIILLAMQGLGKPGVQFASYIGGSSITALSTDPTTVPYRTSFSHPSAISTGEAILPFVPKTLCSAAIVRPPITWYASAAFQATTLDQFKQYTFPPPGCPTIKMIWNENSCLTACWNPGNELVQAFRSPTIEFNAVTSIELHNDALFADIILPAQTSLEVTDLSAYNDYMMFVFLGEAAVAPIGESRNNWQIYTALADHFGVLDGFTKGKTDDEWLQYWFSRHYAHTVAGMSWDDFVKKKYYIVPFPSPNDWDTIKAKNNLKPDISKYYDTGSGLVTNTGKLEFWATNIAQNMPWDTERPPVPHYIPSGRSYQEDQTNPRAKKYPLLLMSNHPRWRCHVQLDGATWIREIPTCKIKGPDGYMYEPLWIHPIDAAKRGIRQGDIVKVYNERGAILCGAYVTERIAPRSLSEDHGSQIDPLGYDANGQVVIDRGGENNIIAPGAGYSYPLQAISAFLVEVEKADVFALMKQYPTDFARAYDPDVGPTYDSWVKG